jgi:hypothetical protein
MNFEFSTDGMMIQSDELIFFRGGETTNQNCSVYYGLQNSHGNAMTINNGTISHQAWEHSGIWLNRLPSN